MSGSESAAATSFYLGLVALCAGAILGARGAVERKRAPLAIPFIVAGALGIVCAVVLYTRGPRRMLPF